MIYIPSSGEHVHFEILFISAPNKEVLLFHAFRFFLVKQNPAREREPNESIVYVKPGDISCGRTQNTELSEHSVKRSACACDHYYGPLSEKRLFLGRYFATLPVWLPARVETRETLSSARTCHLKRGSPTESPLFDLSA